MQDIINRLRSRKADEGFTLIELLVVVVIIGVLVAIAVPVYLNYRKGAADKSAQSDLRGAVSAIEQYYTDNGNVYPADIAATSGTSGAVTVAAQSGGNAATINLSEGTTFQYDLAATGATYVACATNSKGSSGRVYIYNSNGGTGVKTSSQATIALCISTLS